MTSDDQRDTGTPSSSPYGHEGPYASGPQGEPSYPQFVTPEHTSAQAPTYGTAPTYGNPPAYGTPPAYGPAYATAPSYGTAPAAGTAVLERPRRRRGGTLVAATLAAVIGAGAGIGSYAYLDGSQAAGGSSATSPISVTTVPAAITPVLDGTVSAAAAKIDPSVVTITVQAGNSGDIGSGVVLDTDGHILTNDHVVSAAESAQGQAKVTVTLPDGTTSPATIVGTSTTNDLAVIKVDGVSGLQPVTFAKSGTLKVGQAVVAAGAPLGLSESVTSGIVSNTARPVRSGNDNDAVYLAVQTDAAINPGNSGGPLVDLNGSVVGINSSIASTGSSSESSQSGNIGIGFAIPADVAVRVAGELIADGKSVNAALGVTVDGAGGGSFSTETGVPLKTVAPDGAATRAGLRAGDVVTKVQDFHTTTADGLIAATRYYAPGAKVTLSYVRDGGSAQTVDVTLGSA